MPLNLEVKEDPHPEVTAFAKKVIEKGQAFQDQGKWCDTWRGAVAEMGLDPNMVGNPTMVYAEVLVPMQIRLKVDASEFARMSEDEQNQHVAEKLRKTISAPGERVNESLRIDLYREGTDAPDTGAYSDHARFTKVGPPLVFDLNLIQGAEIGGLIKLRPEQSQLSAAMRQEDGDNVRHLLQHVSPEDIGNQRYVAACSQHASWRTPTDNDPFDWCQTCVIAVRSNGWQIELIQSLSQGRLTAEQIAENSEKTVARLREALHKVPVS